MEDIKVYNSNRYFTVLASFHNKKPPIKRVKMINKVIVNEIELYVLESKRYFFLSKDLKSKECLRISKDNNNSELLR